MRYALVVHDEEMTEAEVGKEALADSMAAFDAYAKALEDSGALVSARQPPTRRPCP